MRIKAQLFAILALCIILNAYVKHIIANKYKKTAVRSTTETEKP